jgi:stress response protein SCP2
MNISKGANAPLQSGPFKAVVSFGSRPSGLDVDVSAYLLRSDGQTRGDGDMVFYNQPSSPDGAVGFDQASSTFSIDTAALASDVEKIAFCVVVDGGSADALGWIAIDAGGVSFRHETAGQPEAAIIVAEAYLRAGQWKLRAVGQGFAGGLEPLARSFGIEVDQDDEEAPATTGFATIAPADSPRTSTSDPFVVAAPESAPRTSAQNPFVAEPPKPTGVNLSKVDLRKHKVGVSLAKKGVADVKADVLLVIDASGSMDALYRNGTVQETAERMVPVALKLDDDGLLDTWYYATGCAQMEPLDERSMIGFVARTLPKPNAPVKGTKGAGMFNRPTSIGYGNNEPVVMEAILRQNSGRRPRPLLVLFVTDGGIDESTSDVIKDILRRSSNLPVFWQFIGVGNANYGVLRSLDTIEERTVDNAGFFAVDDLARITDDELYDRMLSEFPDWLKAAAGAGILPPR